MKIDRMLAIIIYLLNHDLTSATALAEKIEVSKRTIQRDIDAINGAGIPIVSTYGANGGYQIIDGFKLMKQLISKSDYNNIISALKGLISAYPNSNTYDTFEKSMLSIPKSEQRIFIDFSVSRESKSIGKKLNDFEYAIFNQKPQEICYINANSKISNRIIEPLALSLQWYSWYLFAYCRERQDYRLFKLSRIEHYESLKQPFSSGHQNIEELMENARKTDNRKRYHVKLLCSKDIKYQILDYFGSNVTEKFENGDFIAEFEVILSDFWLSTLLSFGNKVKVIDPVKIKHLLREKAKEVLSIYE